METFRLSDSELSSPAGARSPASNSDIDDSPSTSSSGRTSDLDSARGAADFLRGYGVGAKAIKQLSSFSVVDEYNGATVLLTGATGYVGKLVLEQLLRTCPGVKKVFLVIRGTKDRSGKQVSAGERLAKMLSGPEFQLLHKQLDALLAKIEVIAADLTTPDLGLSEQQQLALYSETNFVIHCAASIRFDEPISAIMRTNYASTRELLRMAARMPALRCFTYMSTAYVNSNQRVGVRVREELYPLPGTPDPLAEAQALLDLPEKEATKKADKLMKQWGLANTYFVAKTLSERLVMSFDRQPFPVCIVRPSLIGCVASDPYPGYIGNTSGFTALILGTLAGIIRFIQHDPKHHIAVVPGDVVSSATLAATAATAWQPGLLPPVVHVCSSDSYPLLNAAIHPTIGGYLELDPVRDGRKTLVRNGRYSVDWVKSRAAFKLRCAARTVKLAAVSAVLRMAGHARQAKKVMMAHSMWTKLGSSDADFNFTFETPTTDALWQLLPPGERAAFKPVWREELGDSWIRYLRTYTAGVKHLYLKEAPQLTDQQEYRPRC